ncbi:hypothetical protein HOF40_00310 [Candidatus Parcubacteria bacterium]|jgi:hypothetical protein|nr:hypothetical protein [Candidatus Parcubacteria bacterium]MBT3948514.1 hypothetical protein [Candidatus Parcubacteria bacterium]
MEELFEKFNKSTKNIRLSNKERDQMDHIVTAVMDEFPIQKKVETKQKEKKVKIEKPFRFFGLLPEKLAYVALMFVIVVGTGAGTAFASGDALPGEFLYGFKVDVVEEVKSKFLSSSQAKAQYASERVLMRLQEIQELIDTDVEIDDKIIRKVNEKVKEHSKGVVRATGSLQEDGDSEAIMDVIEDLQESLGAYNKLLLSLIEKENDLRVVSKLSDVLENMEATEKAAKTAQIELVVGDDEDYVHETEGKSKTTTGSLLTTGVSKINISAPYAGDEIMIGTPLSVVWEVTEEPKTDLFIYVELWDDEGSFVGYMKYGQATAREHIAKGMVFNWNPKYVFRIISGQVKWVEINPGKYRIRISTTREYRSKIVEYEGETGVLYIQRPPYVISGNTSPAETKIVEISDSASSGEKNPTEISNERRLTISMPHNYSRLKIGQQSQIWWNVNDNNKENAPGYVRLVNADLPNEKRNITFLDNLANNPKDSNKTWWGNGFALWTVPNGVTPGRYYIEIGDRYDSNFYARSFTFIIYEDVEAKVEVSQKHIGPMNIYVGQNHVKIAEFEVRTNKPVALTNLRVSCKSSSGPQSFDNMMLESSLQDKYQTKRVSMMYDEESVSFTGWEFYGDRNKRHIIEDREVFYVYANINSILETSVMSCGLWESNRISFYDYDKKKTISGDGLASFNHGFSGVFDIIGQKSEDWDKKTPYYLTYEYLQILEKIGIDPSSMPEKMTYPLRDCLVGQIGLKRYDTLWYQRDKVSLDDAWRALPCAKYLSN